MSQTENRRLAILRQARLEGRVQATALAQDLGVSVQTIRADLRALTGSGALERIHGGAVLPSGVRHIGYETRRQLNAATKERIATRTARLVPEDASLFINVGTTTEAVARALRTHLSLMVVTNNMNVATTLARKEGFEVHVTGGTLRHSDGALVGDMASSIIERFKVDFAIIGTSAIDSEGDLLDFDAAEVHVAQSILRQARRVILVADRTKFLRKAPVRIGSLRAVDVFVTDAPPPERILNICRSDGVEVLIA